LILVKHLDLFIEQNAGAGDISFCIMRLLTSIKIIAKPFPYCCERNDQ
jgi:hypothetical protein